MFSQYVIDFIGYGIGAITFSAAFGIFGVTVHEFFVGHRRMNLNFVREANEQIVALKKIETGYQKDADISVDRWRHNYCYYI